MKTITLYNIKGGVGKTAAAVNLSFLASQEGARTLLVDLDPQGSASYYFRVRPKKKFNNKSFIEGGEKNRKSIRGTDYDNLDSLPSALSFRKMDITLHAHSKSKTRLKSVLKPMREEYEYLFLDTPPGITLVADNVFRASDMVLVPVIPTTLSVLTYETLTTFFEKHVLDQQKLYAFFSMVEKRKTMHRDIMRSLSTGDRRFLRAAIPYAADVEKMGVHREPVFCFSATSAAAHAYKNLWREVKKKAHE